MVLPCQTFLLTLQDSNCLVDLFCSVDNLEVQNEKLNELKDCQRQLLIKGAIIDF